MPGVFRCDRCEYSCASCTTTSHTRLRVHWAPGIPHALSWGGTFSHNPGAIGVAGMRRCILPSLPLLRQILLQLRPPRVRFAQDARGVGREAVAVLLAAEQIEPLSRYLKEPRVAGLGDAAGQINRVVAAELGPVNLRMGDKGGAVAFIAEAPDRAGLRGLDILQ